MYVCVYNIYVCMCVQYVCMYVCMCVQYVCMYVCVYVQYRGSGCPSQDPVGQESHDAEADQEKQEESSQQETLVEATSG